MSAVTYFHICCFVNRSNVADELTLGKDFLSSDIETETGIINGSDLIAADEADAIITPAGWRYTKDASSPASEKINVCAMCMLISVI